MSFELPSDCSFAIAGASTALPVTACSFCYFPPGGRYAEGSDPKSSGSPG